LFVAYARISLKEVEEQKNQDKRLSTSSRLEEEKYKTHYHPAYHLQRDHIFSGKWPELPFTYILVGGPKQPPGDHTQLHVTRVSSVAAQHTRGDQGTHNLRVIFLVSTTLFAIMVGQLVPILSSYSVLLHLFWRLNVYWIIAPVQIPAVSIFW